MKREVVIVGCGGFGREVFSLVQALCATESSWHVKGFLDDAPSECDLGLVRDLGSKVLGSIGQLEEMGPVNAVIAIGGPGIRELISQRFLRSPVGWSVLVHPDSTIGLNVNLEVGTVVAAGTRLSTNIAVGKHVHIDQNATVGHDVEIGDFARLNPQACVSGSVTIGRRAIIGANATVLQGLHIGRGALVAAGACVVKDVDDWATVKGVPAR